MLGLNNTVFVGLTFECFGWLHLVNISAGCQFVPIRGGRVWLKVQQYVSEDIIPAMYWLPEYHTESLQAQNPTH